MKNNLKKVLALVVALTLALAMALPAFALDEEESSSNYYEGKGNPSITIGDAADETSSSSRTFTAYQLFVGELGTVKDQLGNIEWGSSVMKNGAVDQDLVADIAEAAGATTTSAADVAAAIAEMDGDEIKAFADAVLALLVAAGAEPAVESFKGGVETEVDAGYYIIADITESDDLEGVRSSAMAWVAGPTTINLKTSTPTLDKEITKVNGEESENSDGATAEVGDVIEFTLTGTLPSNYDEFDEYYYVFHDKMSDGLTLNKDDEGEYVVTVTVGQTVLTGGYTVLTKEDGDVEDGCTFHVVIEDLNSVEPEMTVTSDMEIVVTYTATLNENAKVGYEANLNEAQLEYSNDYNKDGDGSTDTTPWDTVYVYTFGLDIDKIDNSEPAKPLQDAKFKLYREATTEEKAAYEEEHGEDAGYAELEYMWATFDGDGNITGWVTSEDAADEVVSDEDGNFKIDGLGEGTYWLKETESPAGYNKIDDLEFVIEAELYDEDQQSNKKGMLESATLTREDEDPIDLTDGTGEDRFHFEIIDSIASTLPGTGGIGTTIFYTVGALVVVAALAYLAISNISKKKAVNC